jgi:uncharacterized alkaline shock family protein YloU
MRFLGGLTLFFYTLVLFLVGGAFIVIALELVPLDTVKITLDTIYMAPNTRMIFGVTGILLICISTLVALIARGKIQREKTIAFENPDGQVTISLTAIEDFIKRSLKQLPEVKDLRPSVRANKKGITIINRVVLFSEVNIPETTEKIQSIVKSGVQDMLGVEEPINIRVHVIKIVHKEGAVKTVKKEDKTQPPQFRGSIEY